MFIYQFNRLIRSRLLWGFFAIIISVAFVSVGSCGRSAGGGSDPGVAGKLNGKKISVAAYDQVDGFIRGFGRNRNTEIPEREVARRVWEQLAARQVAAKNGVTSGKEDIREAIRSQSVFQGPNGFDFDLYREALRRGGFSSETQYENIVGHQLMMEKIGVMIESATWVSPMELEDEIAAMTDKFTVQTVTLSNRFSDVEMRLSDEDYKTFYEENSASFRLPDRMSVRYIAIPVSNYLARVTVTDDLQDYYDAHLDRYQSTDTNNVVSTKSFEDVKDEIFAELQLDEARHCVETNVTFTIFGRLAKAAADNALAAMAAEENVEVVTSPLFAQYEPLPWVSDAREFAEAAFDLEPENFETRVSVVKGKNEIFVMEYHEKSEAHVPVFEDVAANVKTRAQAKARTDAFTSYVTEMRTDISSLLEAGKTFEDAAKEKALNVSTSFTYTANAIQMKPFENSYAIAYSARALRKGELSEAVPVAMSHAMLVYVEDRQQGEALVVDMASSQIRSGLARRRGNTLFSDWFTWNLGQQHLEPTRPLVTSDDDAAAPPDFDS